MTNKSLSSQIEALQGQIEVASNDAIIQQVDDLLKSLRKRFPQNSFALVEEDDAAVAIGLKGAFREETVTIESLYENKRFKGFLLDLSVAGSLITFLEGEKVKKIGINRAGRGSIEPLNLAFELDGKTYSMKSVLSLMRFASDTHEILGGVSVKLKGASNDLRLENIEVAKRGRSEFTYEDLLTTESKFEQRIVAELKEVGNWTNCSKVSDKLKISPTMVREVFRKLEAVGKVSLAHRGDKVIWLTEENRGTVGALVEAEKSDTREPRVKREKPATRSVDPIHAIIKGLNKAERRSMLVDVVKESGFSDESVKRTLEQILNAQPELIGKLRK